MDREKGKAGQTTNRQLSATAKNEFYAMETGNGYCRDLGQRLPHFRPPTWVIPSSIVTNSHARCRWGQPIQGTGALVTRWSASQ